MTTNISPVSSLWLDSTNATVAPTTRLVEHMVSPRQVLRTVRAARTVTGQPVHCCISMSRRVLTTLADSGARTRGDLSTDRYRQVRAVHTLHTDSLQRDEC